MKSSLRKKLLTLAVTAVGVCGVAAHWLWYPSKLSTYVTLLLVVSLLLIMRQAAKWQLFQLSSAFPIPIAQVKPQWNFHSIGMGALCVLAALAWAGILAFGIKRHVLDDISMPVAWLVVSPSLILIVMGVFLIARGMLGLTRNS